MIGIVYISQALITFDNTKLNELSTSAAKRNLELGVTGYLCFFKNHFVQYIESENQTCTQLMSRIAQDERHCIITQLQDCQVDQRRFPNWSMRHITRTELIEINLERMLVETLLFADQIGDHDNVANNYIWRLVDSIAKSQNRLLDPRPAHSKSL